ncbi:MAG: hypothetical protein ATN32_02455 [Candidatus Epulonipiscium fishelsonii]|nr:MAG: hypothetical protein ATN32_02455 [Epulopiscium sp. AS2M-Bin002]
MYSTNIYGSFRTHRSRNHKDCSVNDLKHEILETQASSSGVSVESHFSDSIRIDSAGTEPFDDLGVEDLGDSSFEVQDLNHLSHNVELKVASLLLKLEHIYLVSTVAVDELLLEFDYLIGTASVPLFHQTIAQHLQNGNCQVDETVVQDLASTLCKSNPVTASFGGCGPLSTAWKRNKYYKKHFKVIESIEFVLDPQNKKSFQYISILQSLQQILSCQFFLDKAINLKSPHHIQTDKIQYKSFYDGSNYKENLHFSKECAISLVLYVDDFEICNPLGTSRKKHKICGVYWALGNLPASCHSSLSNIYLAALIYSEDVKCYGFDTVLKPLVDDLVTLEQQGLFVAKLGKTVKGFVHYVVADNLGAHSLTGFVENFSGKYFCRFCTAENVDVQTKEFKSGAFYVRTKDIHTAHLETIKENSLVSHFGVKTKCVLSENLSYFSVTESFPSDIAHDLFEGIIPVEIALCLDALISKKYFTLTNLNESIIAFPFKWTDKTNRPHLLPLTYSIKRTIGGNAHENWSLLRFLPLLIGARVPSNEPVWQVLCDLKDIVELVVAPFHTEDSISYLNFKISEHRAVFQEVFPHERIRPKHHYLEHYPQLIRQFGPLVALWTMRFEAKHSFFKRVIRHTNCYKNVLHSLAQRHQFQTAYNLHMCGSSNPSLEVTNVSTLPLDVLNEDIALAVKQKHPHMDTVNLAKNVSYNGFNYRIGMVVAHGSLAGLPEFWEIVHMIVLQETLIFIVKKLDAWYLEHYRAYDLVLPTTRELKLVGPHELTDPYPLAHYMIGGRRLISLKRYIHS